MSKLLRKAGDRLVSGVAKHPSIQEVLDATAETTSTRIRNYLPEVPRIFTKEALRAMMENYTRDLLKFQKGLVKDEDISDRHG